jgi:uracil-DNA glycosylase
MLENLIPEDWHEALSKEFDKEYFHILDKKVEREYKEHTIFPPKDEIFNSIAHLTPEKVKVVIIGQDPYIKPHQAHGFSFSVKDGVAFPKSLKNIFQEMCNDIGCQYPTNGSLVSWSQQGVLLLNTTLTVRENLSNSHQDFGWNIFTAEILRCVLKTQTPKVFILWGKHAQDLFDTVYQKETNVLALRAPHPSPLSAYRGFFGSKPFSQTNEFLMSHGETPIAWELP